MHSTQDLNAIKPTTPLSKRLFGESQEKQAANYLRKRGMKIVQRNYYCRLGEIDLIMLDSTQQLVFVEVRFRRRDHFGSAIESIGPSKQRKIRRTASHFLLTHPQFGNLTCRFDVIGISPSMTSDAPRYDWIKSAFI